MGVIGVLQAALPGFRPELVTRFGASLVVVKSHAFEDLDESFEVGRRTAQGGHGALRRIKRCYDVLDSELLREIHELRRGLLKVEHVRAATSKAGITEGGTKPGGGFLVSGGQLDFFVTDSGDLLQRAIEVFAELVADGVKLQADRPVERISAQ